MKWAPAKSQIANLSLSSRDIGRVAGLISWLEARPGPGWFYVMGANFHFGSTTDAADFRR